VNRPERSSACSAISAALASFSIEELSPVGDGFAGATVIGLEFFIGEAMVCGFVIVCGLSSDAFSAGNGGGEGWSGGRVPKLPYTTFDGAELG
jgi:hypothetical protein